MVSVDISVLPKQKQAKIGDRILTVDIVKRRGSCGAVNVDATDLKRKQRFSGEAAGQTVLLCAAAAQMAAAAAHVKVLCAVRLQRSIDTLAELRVLVCRGLHALNVKAILQRCDRLIENASLIALHAGHQHMDIPRVRRADPASVIHAALVFAAYFKKIVIQYDLLLRNHGGLLRPAAQHKL